MYHCEKVAFGLPVTLEQLGVKDATREKILAMAKAACAENDTLHNLPFEVNPEMVADAIFAADAFGKAALKK